MRHFALNRAVSLLILGLNQLIFFKDYGVGVCITFGYIIYYFALSSYTLMTVISLETWYRMRTLTRSGDQARYAVEIASGYLIPAALSLAMLAVDFSTEKCSKFRPKFAEERCFFSQTNPAEREAAMVWWLSPIAVIVAVNVFAFAMIVAYFCAFNRQRRGLQERNNQWETLWRYIKLIMGMGICMVFEVISFLADDVDESVWYVFDMINMSQGIYIFIIFTLKREVFREIRRDVVGNKMTRHWTSVRKATKLNYHSNGEFDMKEQSLVTMESRLSQTQC